MTGTPDAAGFCHQDAGHQGSGAMVGPVIEGPVDMTEAVVAALRQVHDPEISVNIYDLGLVYRIVVDAEGDVAIEMTLTSPTCPVAGMMPLMVRTAVGDVNGVGLIEVSMVWDPPWSQDRLSDLARLELSLF
ncbi:FeS assembly SUF system protein [Rhodovulum imhoffii]|uniref:FeS assembly SUF system protein n=1 Tax=Rhodovulum imhoffii TaxID=365340 RepID=A0A2T5BL41_9RHOB|nr:iron-sulfur cluster assembly protein [Rhodovulum imhoffii]MBK5933654.1 SUF system Fe-S cluster assembly protein [Rhodovulum imhoffii]PTM99712.1 FeS assembly SUF system protein [Rhodovulum imhoffii]